tara:strand:+ start:214 stop:402 length:189 start_codon:yes stop_codon:yes gene_type:complete
MRRDKREPWKLSYQQHKKVCGKFRATEKRIQELKDAKDWWAVAKLKSFLRRVWWGIKRYKNK